MTAMNRYGAALALAGLLALGGCETMNSPTNASSSETTNSGNVYSGYGVVQNIELVQGSSGIGGSGIGVGAIAGAVVGGIVGHQVGGGTGQTAATVAGAAGGAYVGHQLEKQPQQQSADVYKVTVRMDNGGYQTLTQSTSANFRVGDRVRIENGVMQRY